MSTLPPFLLGVAVLPVSHGGGGAIGPALAGAATDGFEARRWRSSHLNHRRGQTAVASASWTCP